MSDLEAFERGFQILDFEYHDYTSCVPRRFQVQESSLATERKIWIGPDAPEILTPGEQPNAVAEEHYSRAHLNEAEARRVRDALTELLGDTSHVPQDGLSAYLAALQESERRWPADDSKAAAFAAGVEWAMQNRETL